MKYRNKFETYVAKQIKRSGCKFKYESQKIPYVLARHYIPDFILETPYGKVYIECKGYLRAEDKAKLRAVKRQNPQIDLRIIFYANVKTQINWAVKHGFRYAIGTIPKEWYQGA